MKKILLSILTLLTLSAYAQITVNSSTVALTGKVVVTFSDSGSIPIKAGGANQTWDFSTLRKEQADTMKFFNKSWVTALNGIGNDANLVLTFSSDESSWVLLNKTSSALSFVGNVEDTGSGPLAYYKFSDVIVKFPITYNSVFKDSSIEITNTTYLGLDPDGPGPAPKLDSLRYKTKEVITRTGLGWGKVKLTNMAMVDAIMVENKTVSKDMFDIFTGGSWSPVSPGYYTLLGLNPSSSTDFEHNWWSDKEEYGFPLIAYSFEQGKTTAKYIEHLKGTLTNSSVNSITNSYITLYPNPANDIVYFKNVKSANASIKIFDIKGSVVLNSNVTDAGLNLSFLTSGVYNILVIDNDVMHQFKITKL